MSRFFATPAKFRVWLEAHHETESELYVGFHKIGSGKPSITWPQSVDEALCFGWIDGVRKSIDDTAYVIRFTPRRTKNSIWSRVNLKRVPELMAEGRMAPAGIAAYEMRNPARADRYSFEQGDIALPDAMEKLFRKRRSAWTFFESQAPSYRKAALWWVVSAKQEATQKRRLDTLIADSAAGQRIEQMRRP
ncbi:MAG: YdeI/OmpD-associated family protein [Longimicrobiales bacterium]